MTADSPSDQGVLDMRYSYSPLKKDFSNLIPVAIVGILIDLLAVAPLLSIHALDLSLVGLGREKSGEDPSVLLYVAYCHSSKMGALKVFTRFMAGRGVYGMLTLIIYAVRLAKTSAGMSGAYCLQHDVVLSDIWLNGAKKTKPLRILQLCIPAGPMNRGV